MDVTTGKRALRAIKRRGGFTLVEAMIVVAIVGIVMAAATPNVSRYFEHGRGRAAAKSIADALNMARGQAIRTGNNQVVFFSAGLLNLYTFQVMPFKLTRSRFFPRTHPNKVRPLVTL